MQIKQEPIHFNPITLTLETREEAEALLSLADRVCNCVASEGAEIVPDSITRPEHNLAIAISNAFTNSVVSA
jgi:hypothetical protein